MMGVALIAVGVMIGAAAGVKLLKERKKDNLYTA
jgi:uncharacterized membrane protein YfcA